MWKIMCNSSFIFIKFFNHNLVVLKRAHVTSKENSNFNVSWDSLYLTLYFIKYIYQIVPYLSGQWALGILSWQIYLYTTFRKPCK